MLAREKQMPMDHRASFVDIPAAARARNVHSQEKPQLIHCCAFVRCIRLLQPQAMESLITFSRLLGQPQIRK